MKCTVLCPCARGLQIQTTGELIYICLGTKGDPVIGKISKIGNYNELKNTDCLLPADKFCEEMTKRIRNAQSLIDKRKAEIQGGE